MFVDKNGVEIQKYDILRLNASHIQISPVSDRL